MIRCSSGATIKLSRTLTHNKRRSTEERERNKMERGREKEKSKKRKSG